MLAVAKTPRLAGAADAEIELPHIGISSQRLGIAIDDHLARLHDVAGMRDRERDRGVLLDQQHRDALLRVDAGDDAEDTLDQHRRQAK